MAVGLALRQKQAAVLKWLFPLTASHTLVALYYLYQIGFRLLHLRAGLASTMIAYGFLIVGGPVSLVCHLAHIRFCQRASADGCAPAGGRRLAPAAGAKTIARLS